MGHKLITDQTRIAYYMHIHRHGKGMNEPRWRGVRVVKFPTDLILYAEQIFANKPDWIIETGTRFGGSSTFFGDMLQLSGGKGVISIDIESENPPPHPMVQYLVGSSADRELVAGVAAQVAGDRVMVVLDSDHRARHVRRELRLLAPLVTEGQFCVVEDCYTRHVEPYYPAQAVAWFLERTKDFRLEPVEDKFLFAVTRGGWLRRV